MYCTFVSKVYSFGNTKRTEKAKRETFKVRASIAVLFRGTLVCAKCQLSLSNFADGDPRVIGLVSTNLKSNNKLAL